MLSERNKNIDDNYYYKLSFRYKNRGFNNKEVKFRGKIFDGMKTEERRTKTEDRRTKNEDRRPTLR